MDLKINLNDFWFTTLKQAFWYRACIHIFLTLNKNSILSHMKELDDVTICPYYRITLSLVNTPF